MKAKLFRVQHGGGETKMVGFHLEDSATQAEKDFWHELNAKDPLADYVFLGQLEAGRGSISADPTYWLQWFEAMRKTHQSLIDDPSPFGNASAVVTIDADSLPAVEDNKAIKLI